MSKRPAPIKFDTDSLERLINESYQEIFDEQENISKKLNDLNEVGDNSQYGIETHLQQFGEIYTRFIEAKGKVSDRKIKLTQLLKEIYKMVETDKKEDPNADSMSPQRAAELAEELEEELKLQQEKKLEEENQNG